MIHFDIRPAYFKNKPTNKKQNKTKCTDAPSSMSVCCKLTK